MVPLVRMHRFAFVAITAVGIAVLGGIGLVAAGAVDNGDPDPQADGEIAVCSDVPVHAWLTVNISTEARPDNRKVDYDLEATGHGCDPFDRDGRRRCVMVGPAFGSRVDFRTPGLDDGQPFSVTAPTDHRHVLIVRFTKNADYKVTATQEPVDRPG